MPRNALDYMLLVMSQYELGAKKSPVQVSNAARAINTPKPADTIYQLNKRANETQ
jgi:hypothetical protein